MATAASFWMHKALPIHDLRIFTAAFEKVLYDHVPHDDISVKEGLRIRQWSHKISTRQPRGHMELDFGLPLLLHLHDVEFSAAGIQGVKQITESLLMESWLIISFLDNSRLFYASGSQFWLQIQISWGTFKREQRSGLFFGLSATYPALLPQLAMWPDKPQAQVLKSLVDTAIPLLGIHPREVKNMCPHEDLYTDVHNSLKGKTAQTPINS
uniref:Uncharacterized protein n=1 Tax=Equus caballus TaxID=9796 RepID=Q4W443_HORSE|nr:hypothetical protein [Equus caballus]